MRPMLEHARADALSANLSLAVVLPRIKGARQLKVEHMTHDLAAHILHVSLLLCVQMPAFKRRCSAPMPPMQHDSPAHDPGSALPGSIVLPADEGQRHRAHAHPHRGAPQQVSRQRQLVSMVVPSLVRPRQRQVHPVPNNARAEHGNALVVAHRSFPRVQRRAHLSVRPPRYNPLHKRSGARSSRRRGCPQLDPPRRGSSEHGMHRFRHSRACCFRQGALAVFQLLHHITQLSRLAELPVLGSIEALFQVCCLSRLAQLPVLGSIESLFEACCLLPELADLGLFNLQHRLRAEERVPQGLHLRARVCVREDALLQPIDGRAYL